MNIIDIAIKRPVTVVMGALALAMFGLLAYCSLPVSLLPETKIAVVTVQTVYPGAGPQIVESQLTKRIEDEVFSLADVDSLASYSMDSISIITVTFRDGKDENLAIQEVKDKVDAILPELPDAVEKPAISKIDVAASIPIMNIVLEGGMDSTELYTLGSTVVHDALSQISGVGSVEISGGQKREIRVNLDRAAAYKRFLPVEQVAAILAQANVELPGGNIGLEGEDIPVRFRGEFTSLEEIGDLDIPTSAGLFKLRQLGTIEDTHIAVRERTILRDKAAGTRNEGALLIRIMKNPSANTIAVVDAVMKQIPRIEAEAGGGVRLAVLREDAGFIRDSVNDTFSNLIIGIVLTGLVILLFLHDLRSTFIISLSMPFSIIATFFVMQLLNISVNVLSLMGLSCAVGTLVANSVVALENIFRYKNKGFSRTESAARGTKEVMMAVIASTLTNVVVFVPLGGMGGAMGQIISHFAYTVVISTAFSIVASFVLTPFLASRILPEKVRRPGHIGRALDGLFNKTERLYAASLAVMLKRKWRSALVVIAVGVVFIVSMRAFTSIPMELVPKSDGGKIQLDVELPQGSDLDKTAAVLVFIEERLVEYPEVKTILTTLGKMGAMDRDVSVARMEVSLVPKTERSLSNSDLASLFTRNLSDIPGADIRVTAPSELVIAQGAPVDLKLRGPDTLALQELGGQIKRRLQSAPGIMNVNSNMKAGKSELVFEPRRKQISSDGITVQTVALALRSAVDGMAGTVYRENDEEYDIRVKIEDSALRDIEDLKNIPVASPVGIFPLSRYADMRFASGYNMIMRLDKQRTANITAELLPGYAQGPVLADVMQAAAEIELPEGYSIRQAGLSEAMEESNLSMAVVFLTAIILVYMLLAAILESPLQPVFILSTIPLSLIGVVAGCLLFGTVLNNIAMIGIVMLVGVVVNNAILMLDYYNQLKREGLGATEALLKACPTKLKAILMSNIAIILGMIPMALGIGASLAEMRQPMGIITIGGIVSSTILTLWFIPALERLVIRRAKKLPGKGNSK
ncbi:MAG: efflux RND transporter permease subunit [Treponema sp.]|jgi:HAE1 family hydrophobic/amphiphilic exporter-1|nr:efflux RND transporter permease subunit [Treponema sp.]